MVSAGQHQAAGARLASAQTLCRVAVTGLTLPGNGACCPGGAGFPGEHWFFCDKSPDPRRNPALPQSVMPVMRRALVPEVLPAVMPDRPAVPDVPARAAAGARPAVPASRWTCRRRDGRRWPRRWPARCPARSARPRAAWSCPVTTAPLPGMTPGWRGSAGSCARCRTTGTTAGRRIPLDYLTAVAVAAGAAGDDSPEGGRGVGRVGPGPGPAPARRPARGSGQPRRPDAATLLPGPGRPPPRAAGRRRAVRMGRRPRP